jgi:hypothetical protein
MAEVTEVARARVAKLVENWDWPDPAILEDILALGTDAVPAIDELLTPERVAATVEDAQADAIVYYAIKLLGALGDPAAFSILLRLLHQADDEALEVINDALRVMGPAAIPALAQAAGDETMTPFARNMALGAVHDIAGDHPEVREQASGSLRSILARYVEQAEPLTDHQAEVASWLIADLSDMADPAARPLIEAAFAQGWVDTFIVRPAHVEQSYEDGPAPPENPIRPYPEQYRDDLQNHQEELEKKARRSLLDPPTPPQPVVLGPKLGRNDPCWCGSGKKYKKCHLAQDEKGKIRL